MWWKQQENENWKWSLQTPESLQPHEKILTDEELRLGEMKVFSKNANLVAKLVQ